MKLTTALLTLGLLIPVAGTANATTYTFVGQWKLGQGPVWSETDIAGNYTTGIFNGREAAAFLFGGTASDYVISTISNLASSINFSAWLDGWGDTSYATTPASDTFKFDANGDGLYATPFVTGGAFSALIADHFYNYTGNSFDPANASGPVNYAFRVSAVPLPAALPLLLTALGGMGAVARKRRLKAKGTT
jgi:hypothetical protein